MICHVARIRGSSFSAVRPSVKRSREANDNLIDQIVHVGSIRTEPRVKGRRVRVATSSGHESRPARQRGRAARQRR
jgi:hypothetical protein